VREFKEHEAYAMLKIPPGIPFIVRCDGRNFRDLCDEVGFQKPYDEEFAKLMVGAAKSVFNSGFNPSLAYIQSDEVSYLFMRESAFNRRIEKLLSIIPSTMSSYFSIQMLKKFGKELSASFDARIVMLSKSDVIDYFIWRQMEAWRNHINSYAFYALIRKGFSRRSAAQQLAGLKSEQLHELVFKELGINLAKTPAWQRRGIVLRWKIVSRRGVNPLTGEVVEVKRRILVEDWRPPLFSSPEGRKYIVEALEEAEKEIN